jgi:hypothetical protein
VYYDSAPTVPVTRFKFWVYEQNADDDGILHDNTSEPKEFAASTTLCKELLRWMEKVLFIVTIERKGSDLKTQYIVDPVLS